VARSFCGSACTVAHAGYVVSRTERGVGDGLVASTATGYDVFGREIFTQQDQPGGRQSLRILSYDQRGLLVQESVPSPCCATPTRWIKHAYDLLERRTSTERAGEPVGVHACRDPLRHDDWWSRRPTRSGAARSGASTRWGTCCRWSTRR